MQQTQTNQSTQIHKNSILFTQFYQLLQKANDVIVVCGPKQAGKSVTVDLLTDKVLQNYEKEEDQKKYVAQQNNFDAIYNNIYFQFLQKTNTLVLEGFTLDAEKKQIKANLFKTFFIRTCLQSYKKIAFVIVVDQSRKQQTEQLDKLLQHFLQCLNIHEEIDSIKAISQNIYLLLAKTEESNAILQFYPNCQYLQQKGQHEGVRHILNSIRQQQKVLMFPNDEPEANLGKKIRDAFKTKIIQKADLQKLNNTEVYPAFLGMLSTHEKQQAINTFDQLLKLLNAFFNLLLQKTKDNKTYQNAKANLYKEKLDKQLSLQNLKKTSWQGLKKLSPKQRITKESIQRQQAEKGYMLLIQYVQTILNELQSKSTVKNNYDCIIGTLLYIKYLTPCLDGQLISNNMSKLIDSSRNLQMLFGQNQIRQKQVSAPKITKKVVEKKGGNKAATIFKQQVMRLKNNEEFIKFTITKIKQKEANDNFEPNDVIYHLKCLRELLQSYDAQQKSENRHFIQEILDIYAFNENLYEFETNLKKYIQKKEIPLSSLQKLIKKADQLKSYQNQVRLINYAIAHTFDDRQFRFLNRMKELVRIKQHDQYQARCENKELNNVQKKVYNLSVSFQAIKKKAKSYWLNSQSFKKVIEAEE